MSLILQRYARVGNCLKCHLTFSRQIEVRRFLSCSRLLRNQPNKEVAPSAENVDGQLQTSFAKKGMYVNGLHINRIIFQIYGMKSDENSFLNASGSCTSKETFTRWTMF